MTMNRFFFLLAAGLALLSWARCSAPTEKAETEAPPTPEAQTVVSIQDSMFLINGEPTYAGRTWNGHTIEGLLFNSRMVQGIFDDKNPETRPQFHYPDTDEWDPDRNTREFVAAMPSWRDHGVLAFTLNLQGGSPIGYGNKDWHNSAFDEQGMLKPAYAQRLTQVLDAADSLGMVVILGYFYFGQDQNLADEAAIIQATDQATDFLVENGYRNVLVEVNNECNVKKYDHDILMPERVHELIERVQQRSEEQGQRLLAGTSYGGGFIPLPNVVAVSDFILIHGNGVGKRDGTGNPARIREMVAQTRAVEGYHGQPILFNEDDHYEFDKEESNLVAAVDSYASWGFFDFRREGEPYAEGFQTVPVDWTISTERKRGFYEKVKEITGY